MKRQHLIVFFIPSFCLVCVGRDLSSCAVGSPVGEDLPSCAVGSPVGEDLPSCAVGSPVGEDLPPCAVGSPVGEDLPPCAVGSPVGEDLPSCAVGSPVGEDLPSFAVGSLVEIEDVASPVLRTGDIAMVMGSARGVDEVKRSDSTFVSGEFVSGELKVSFVATASTGFFLCRGRFTPVPHSLRLTGFRGSGLSGEF